MLGNVAGKTIGLAPEANIVLVKYNDGRGYFGHGIIPALFDGLLKVYDHVKSQRPTTNCILNMSLGWTKDWFEHLHEANGFWGEDGARLIEEAFANILEEILEGLAQLPNLIWAVSAGNLDPHHPIKQYPALLADDKFFDKKMVVVGAYDHRTGKNFLQSSDFVHVWAPGKAVNVPCPAKRAGPEHYQREKGLCHVDGTSPAAAMVSGMLASWLSAGIKIDEVIEHMYGNAYPRVENGVRALYNGVPIEKWPEAEKPAWYKNGDSPPLPPDSYSFQHSRSPAAEKI
ncbi:hypothetical protein TWF730_008995 [Orbilia blumenaviensis]|uniref:Peptidase S8/S53 domain-containing protein n=1 Tax=Orbilia blumenaviensis TaxID=1796055 RepID=A0AAV9UYG3_9PEZI